MLDPSLNKYFLPLEGFRYHILNKLFGVEFVSYLHATTEEPNKIQTVEVHMIAASWKNSFCVSPQMLLSLDNETRDVYMDDLVLRGLSEICAKAIDETQF